MDEKLQTETIEIRPVRLFRCPNHKHNLTRMQVKKGKDGKYRCNSCEGIVEDVTATETGQEILRWMSTKDQVCCYCNKVHDAKIPCPEWIAEFC